MESEGTRCNICDYYLGEGVLIYLTLERAAKALANLVGYDERGNTVASLDANS